MHHTYMHVKNLASRAEPHTLQMRGSPLLLLCDDIAMSLVMAHDELGSSDR